MAKARIREQGMVTDSEPETVGLKEPEEAGKEKGELGSGEIDTVPDMGVPSSAPGVGKIEGNPDYDRTGEAQTDLPMNETFPLTKHEAQEDEGELHPVNKNAAPETEEEDTIEDKSEAALDETDLEGSEADQQEDKRAA